MSDTHFINNTQIQLEEIGKAFDEGVFSDMRYQLRSLSPSEIAQLLESSPPRLRKAIWIVVKTDDRVNQILLHLNDDVRASFLLDIDSRDLAAAADELDTDDFVDILQQLPETITAEVFGFMSARDRQRVKKILAFEEGSAGGLMSTEVITVRPRNRIDMVLRYLRRHESLPEMTDSLVVVNSADMFIGLLPINKILTTDPRVTVREVMDTDIEPLPYDLSDSEVAFIFARDDLISAPVVDSSGHMLGRITIDDVVDVMREDTEHTLKGLSGVGTDEDVFAPFGKMFTRRNIWLGINLITAVIAAAVVQQFEQAIAKTVSLAILMPVVASMSGIAGTQILTLVVRGMALGQIGQANLGWLIKRELILSLANGVVWATVISIGTGLLFQDITLGYTIAIAIVVSIVIATMTGAFLPSILKFLKIDPAISGGVILTTVTDVVGFASFLGLATWINGI